MENNYLVVLSFKLT